MLLLRFLMGGDFPFTPSVVVKVGGASVEELELAAFVNDQMVETSRFVALRVDGLAAALLFHALAAVCGISNLPIIMS